MNLKEVVTALSAFEDERRLVFPDNVFIEYIGHDGDEEEYNGILAQLSKNEKFKLCDDFGFYFSQQEISNVMEAVGDEKPERIIDDKTVISLIGQLKKFWPDKTPIQVTQKISYIVLNLMKLMEDGLKIAYYGEIDENKYFSLFLYHLTGKDVLFIEPLKTLEAITGVPNSKLVTMKGTFATKLEPLNERIRKGNKVNVRNTNVTNIIDNKAMNVIGNIVGTEKDFIYKEIKVKFPIYSLIQLKDEWEIPLYARQDFLNTNERVEYSAILYEICGIYSDARKYINLYNEFISEIEAEAQNIDELFNDKEFEKKVSASLISKMAGNYIHPDEFQKYEFNPFKYTPISSIFVNSLNSVLHNETLENKMKKCMHILNFIEKNPKVCETMLNFSYSGKSPKMKIKITGNRNPENLLNITEFFANFGWDIMIFSPAGLEIGIKNKINLDIYTLEDPFKAQAESFERKKRLLGKFW